MNAMSGRCSLCGSILSSVDLEEGAEAEVLVRGREYCWGDKTKWEKSKLRMDICSCCRTAFNDHTSDMIEQIKFIVIQSAISFVFKNYQHVDLLTFDKESVIYDELYTALKKAVEDYGTRGGPWNVPKEPGTWIQMAKDALKAADAYNQSNINEEERVHE